MIITESKVPVIMFNERCNIYYIITPIGLKNPRKIRKAEYDIANEGFEALVFENNEAYKAKQEELIANRVRFDGRAGQIIKWSKTY